ncbi:hypothetical protein [Calothrix sp. 336/3]|uniref:hypothetical protein n=1 Tax=Calothrix sp. 336/3 TaxID=1337936 RepID=UPI0004E4285C|nr:hypothetical protein [Calothrix sp. 336/3]AKG24253.1 hypothetical protein IJ00_25670 [Calothrix sp. 336/3]
MSTQLLLDEDDIKELTKLMLVMIETQESRKQICRDLGINPHEVSFIIGTSDDTFCTELIDSLNRFGYQEYICKLCCDKLFPILNKSVYSHRISTLKKIVEKLNCNCNQETKNYPIPTVPNLDESKPESWFTRIGKTKNFIAFSLGAGFISILLGILLYPRNHPIIANVDPRLPTPPAIDKVKIKKGDVVEVRPDKDFKWACEPDAKNPVGPGGGRDFDKGYMLPSAPFCSLIAKVGTGAWYSLADTTTFTADNSGSLYLTANDVKPSNCPLDDKQECYSDNQVIKNPIVTIQIRK